MVVFRLCVLQMGIRACPLSRGTTKGKTVASEIATATAEDTGETNLKVVTTNILRFTCMTHVLAS